MKCFSYGIAIKYVTPKKFRIFIDKRRFLIMPYHCSNDFEIVFNYENVMKFKLVVNFFIVFNHKKAFKL